MYILPQVQIFQEFRQVPDNVVKNLNPFIFGPNYKLFRYDEAEEKDFISLGTYDPDDNYSYAFPARPVGSTVDESYTKVYMDNVWAKYASIITDYRNPLVSVSAGQRNQLRAAPHIKPIKSVTATSGIAMQNIQSGSTDIACPGYFTGKAQLPETYYFYPVGGSVAGVWSPLGYKTDYTDDVGEAGRYNYISTEGNTGHVDINSNVNPLSAGTIISVPDLGIHLDMADNGGNISVNNSGVSKTALAPRVIQIDGSGTSWIRVALKTSALKDIIDWAVDDDNYISVKIVESDLDNVDNVDYAVYSNYKLVINIGDGEITHTIGKMKDLYSALTSASITEVFTITASTNIQDTPEVIDIDTDVPHNYGCYNGSALTTGEEYIFLPDCYKVIVEPNDYTFKTGNGYNRSTQFNSRDVTVGDYIKWQTELSAGAVQCEAKITNITYDMTTPIVGEVSLDAANVGYNTNDPSYGIDKTDADIDNDVDIVPDSENQRYLNGTGSGLRALYTVDAFGEYPGDYTNGILSDIYTITITKSGSPGIAEASVVNSEGTYARHNVVIDANADIYLGNNMVMHFATNASHNGEDLQFFVNDKYTTTTISANYDAIDTRAVYSGGAYSDSIDTTFIIDVIRGGLFNRSATAIPGLQTTSGVTAAATVDWTKFSGDIDDEYILEVVTGGSLSSATFSAKSLLGDIDTNIQFSDYGNEVYIGRYGVKVTFTASSPGTFTKGDWWSIKVLGSRPMVKIIDTAGVGQAITAVITTADYTIPLGLSDASLTFASNYNRAAGFDSAQTGGLVKGDRFYVECKAAAPGPYKTLVLSEDIPLNVIPGITANGTTSAEQSLFSAELYLVKSGVSIPSKRALELSGSPEYNWQVSQDLTELNVYSGINITDNSVVDLSNNLVFLPVAKADMFVEYRALLSDYSDSIYSITEIGDIEDTVGIVDPDNPLAYGLYKCMQNSADRIVYFMATPTDDFTGYSDVIDAAAKSPNVYAFAPITQDKNIHELIEAHLDAMSTEAEKQWRIGFFGIDMPQEVARYTIDTNPAEEDWTATIEDDVRYAGSQYTRLVLVNDNNAADFLDQVTVGDIVKLNFGTDAWGDDTYDQIPVASIESNSVLYLATSLEAPVTIPIKIEIVHTYNVNEQADILAATAGSYANRRVFPIFPPYLGSAGKTVGSEFVGCAVAGLACSVAPQQGLTNVELNGFDDLSLCYRVFSKAQLNTMAENGMFIVTQDTPADRIYVRHQLSSAASDNNLLTAELSITKNFDSVSYYFKAVLSPFYGKYNITPEIIEVIKTQIENGINYLASQTSVGLLGPQVIKDDGERKSQIKTIMQHPVMKDHLYALVDIALPYPLNNLDLHIVI